MIELKHDPVEDTEEYKWIEKELEEKLASYIEEFKKNSDEVYESFGIWPAISHRVWAIKKKILKDDYGIEWKSPPQMNPEVIFD